MRVAPFGQPHDGALKGVAVGVDHAGQHRTAQSHGGGLLRCGRLRRYVRPAAIRTHAQQHLARPGSVHPGLRGYIPGYFIFHSMIARFHAG